ncbi:MAG: phospholipid carrier-dependent glycosyltransferase [Capsulimonadales bacterium]|nr:phospholipid carrier-dependent glycosyltransferase [Capsulimonadales bacterium]
MEHLNAPAVLVPLLVIAWFTRELWPLLRRTMTAEPASVPEPEPLVKADFLSAATIAVAFYLLCLWRLATPQITYFDEVHHVRSAMEYLWGQPPHEWSHPPFAKLIMAASLRMFDVSFNPTEGVWSADTHYPDRVPIAWRFPAVCFGTLALLGTFALTRTLFNSRSVATAATTLLALDGVFFVHSRIGMTNIFTVCFIVYGTLGTWLCLKRADRRWLLLSGVALGLALCTRWSSLWAWGLNGLLLIWHLVRVEIPRWQQEKRSIPLELARWAVTVGAAMLLLPLALYLVSYIPFVLQGTGDWQTKLLSSGEKGTPDWSRVFERNHYAHGHGWYKVLNQQKDMWNYHAEIKDTHPYSAPWWSWPLMLRPTWYHFHGANNSSTGIWAIGNAVLWWTSVPVLAATALLAVRERIHALGVVSLLGFGMWLCWGIKARPLVFTHYYFEAIPFACIALAYLGWRLWQSGDESARRFVSTIAKLAGFWFIFYYPLLSAQPIPDWYFRLHLWLDRIWV